ncbi:hypothetical protein ApAK_08730 [Thermoplasmatales archaeon AK]|nr:hypothetical protein [Thermoplasmatales archaeon AK]
MGLRTSDLVKLGERLRQLIKDQTDQSSMTRVVGIGADGTATTYIDKITICRSM